MRKKLILVRTNFNNNIGLGHIYRTKKLSLEFESKNYQIIFLLDKFNYLDKKVIKYKKIYLYPNNKKFKNQAASLLKTINQISSSTSQKVAIESVPAHLPCRLSTWL